MGDRAFETQGFHELRAIGRRRRKRILLPTAVLLIMLLALVGIAVYDYRAMRTDVLALSRGVIDNLQSRIETEVEAYLRPIPGTILLARDLFRARGDKRLDSAQMELVAIGILRNTPQLTALYVGDTEGQFRMARRVDGGAIEVKRIRKTTGIDSGFENEITRYTADGKLQSRELQPWDGYDARQRPWYTGSIEAGGLFWTDVYPFFTSQAAGITAAHPNLDDQGAAVSVVGADVTLDDISDFLASLTIGKTGTALVIDDAGRLIGHPHAPLLRPDADGKLRLSRIADLGDATIHRAFDRYRVEGHGRRDFELDGRRYISSVSSLNHLLNRNWSVLVVVPEDDFVGFVVDNVSKTLLLGLAVIGLAAGLALLLIRQGLRTDREAVTVLERQALLDAEERAFTRLASAGAAGSDKTDPFGLKVVTETLAEATGARRVSVWALSDDKASLYCHDCFDRETVGHTVGARLDARGHPALFELLGDAMPIVASPTEPDARLASLHSRYLDPAGCNAVLGTTIARDNTPRGVLWLEDRRDRPWAQETRPFIEAVAALIVLRGFRGEAAPTSVAPPASTVEHGAVAGTLLTENDIETDTSLDLRRAEAFAARFDHLAMGQAHHDSEAIGRLPVMVLRLTDAVALAQPAHDIDSETTLAYLLRVLQEEASEHGVGYLKFLSDQMIASVDPAMACHEGVQRLVTFALRSKQLCESVLARHHAPLAFRIGIDLGPAVGTVVGEEYRRFALWGEAVQTASEMANSALPGTIQVTETVYGELHDEYLFQLRGHHYLDRLGEFSTYLLSNRR
jgi:class 3 adenylate cyclase